VILFSN